MDPNNVSEIVSELSLHHQRQAALCDELEGLADALPVSLNNQRCLTVARQIFPIVQRAHQFEEQTLFPMLDLLSNKDESLNNSLERLRFEHWEDESFAEELSECLLEFGKSNSKSDADKLSYMLRGFFEGLRRHMAFEAEHLLPMLQTEVIAHSH